MDEKPKKVQKYVKVAISEKDFNLLSDLKDSVRKLLNSRLQTATKAFVEKIRRGTRI